MPLELVREEQRVNLTASQEFSMTHFHFHALETSG